MRSVHEKAPVAPSGDSEHQNESHIQSEDSYADHTVKIDVEKGSVGRGRDVEEVLNILDVGGDTP